MPEGSGEKQIEIQDGNQNEIPTEIQKENQKENQEMKQEVKQEVKSETKQEEKQEEKQEVKSETKQEEKQKENQNEIETVIEVKNVRKVYRMGTEKIFAVDGVDFEIKKGEFCCLLGTSGSGKSTLLNLMAGIEKLSSGEIIIKGKKIHKMSENNLARFRQRYLGFIFQSYNLMNAMTALENVEFPLIFKRVKPKRRKLMAKDMLTKVGLGSRLAHKPNEMSGGQQQRVGIARAFVSKPEIVFADEPTGNLDTRTAMEVMELMRGIARENKQTIVMVTHDRRLSEYADKVIHILDGKIQSIEIQHVTEESKKEGAENETREEIAGGNDTGSTHMQ